MPRPTRRYGRVAAVSLIGLSLIAAGCGSSSKSSTATPTSAATPKGSGPVDVLSAGSLQDLMQKTVGPAFHTATGYTLTDTSMGSSALASDIKGKTMVGDVFISAAPSVNATLEGAANGNWVSWYSAFASSPLEFGYNPASKFAADLKTMPWYKVVTMPGFLVGRTDPATDPKGALVVKAIDQVAAAQNLPALKTILSETNTVFGEDALEGEVGSGQLDGGFFYLAEAQAANIPTVPLTGVNLAGDYTITVLNRAPHTAAADAFVKFLLGSAGQKLLKADSFMLVSPPQLSGSGVPPALTSVVGGS